MPSRTKPTRRSGSSPSERLSQALESRQFESTRRCIHGGAERLDDRIGSLLSDDILTLAPAGNCTQSRCRTLSPLSRWPAIRLQTLPSSAGQLLSLPQGSTHRPRMSAYAVGSWHDDHHRDPDARHVSSRRAISLPRSIDDAANGLIRERLYLAVANDTLNDNGSVAEPPEHLVRRPTTTSYVNYTPWSRDVPIAHRAIRRCSPLGGLTTQCWIRTRCGRTPTWRRVFSRHRAVLQRYPGQHDIHARLLRGRSAVRPVAAAAELPECGSRSWMTRTAGVNDPDQLPSGHLRPGQLPGRTARLTSPPRDHCGGFGVRVRDRTAGASP